MSLRTGTIDLTYPVALGPMAGVTDMPYRKICREMGANLFYTEMISAKALHFRNKNTESLMATYEGEENIGVQLFGSDPDIMAEEALKIEDRFDFIDINMGCPVHKIVSNGEGSFLLTQPDLVKKILKKMVESVHKPVSVKMRKGFHTDETQCLEIAKICEDCGVSFIAVHGRCRDEFYSGKADWEIIRKVKERVKIPVIGNGDIRSYEDAEKMMEETGCDGVMVGRAAEGDPWLFREIRAGFEKEEIPERPEDEEIRRMVLRHALMLSQFKGEHTAILEMRKHAAWYMKGCENAAILRKSLSEIKSLSELQNLLF